MQNLYVFTCNFTTPANKRLRDRPPETSMLQLHILQNPVNINLTKVITYLLLKEILANHSRVKEKAGIAQTFHSSGRSKHISEIITP